MVRNAQGICMSLQDFAVYSLRFMCVKIIQKRTPFNKRAAAWPNPRLNQLLEDQGDKEHIEQDKQKEENPHHGLQAVQSGKNHHPQLLEELHDPDHTNHPNNAKHPNHRHPPQGISFI